MEFFGCFGILAGPPALRHDKIIEFLGNMQFLILNVGAEEHSSAFINHIHLAAGAVEVEPQPEPGIDKEKR